MKQYLRDQHGMTAVELLVALVLVTAISTVIVNFAIDKLRQNTQQQIKYSLLADAETGLNTVANDVRLSARADDANRWQDENAPLAPSNELSWTSDNNTLVLATAAQDSDKNILFDDAHDYVSTKNNYIYYVEGTTLYRRMLAAPVTKNSATTTCPPELATSDCPVDKVIMEDVHDFTVTYYDGASKVSTPSNARSVKLEVTLSSNRYGQDISVSYTTRMVFRNG